MNSEIQTVAGVANRLASDLTLDATATQSARAQRLRTLILHGRNVSPLWRSRLSGVDLRDPETTLRSVPILTRSELAGSVSELSGNPRLTPARLLEAASRPAEPIDGQYYVIATGGSTGEPVRIPVTVMEAAFDAALAARRQRPLMSSLGIDPVQARRASVVSSIDGPHATSLWRRLFPGPGEQIAITRPLEDIAVALERMQPEILATYPSLLPSLLARGGSGESSIAPKVVLLGAENIDALVAEQVRETWGSRMINMWGASEVGMLASSDGFNDGLLLNDDWAVIELLDAAGDPVQPGERFERVVVTPLARTTVPLFRYEITDVGSLIDDNGPFRRISDIDGRAANFLKWSSGSVHPGVFSSILNTDPAVALYQIRQTETGLDVAPMTVRNGQPDLQRIEQALRRAIDAAVPDPTVVIRLMDDMPRTGSAAKHLAVVPLERTPATDANDYGAAR